MSNHTNNTPEEPETGAQGFSAGDREWLMCAREGLGLFSVQYSPITKAVTRIIKVAGYSKELRGRTVEVHRGDWHKYLDKEVLGIIADAPEKTNRSD